MKVHDLAKELGKHTKELIHFLREVDIYVKSGSTKLEPDTVTEIRELFKGEPGVKQKAPDRSGLEITTDTISISDLAALLKVNLSEIMQVVLGMGLLLNLNSMIDRQTGIEIAKKLGIEILDAGADDQPTEETGIRSDVEKITTDEQELDPDALVERPPVITIMGHVDHGKTLLLDTIRSSNVIAKEAGGITQHIGAYQVTFKGKKLTFLDTPGHAAFTALRARGAQVTDITILVVAADEGVKPQTEEALDHAKAAGVPIIVAINKVDKPGANPETVKQQLSNLDLVPEDWGGSTVMVPLSAKTNEGIDQLLDMILLVAEVQELKANPSLKAKGVVIESRLSRQKGPIATILVKSGTLRVGDSYIIDTTYGKVRALFNDLGQPITEADPGMPVEILGISEVPKPGSILECFESEKRCRSEINKRLDTQTDTVQIQTGQSVSFESISQEASEENSDLRLNLIVKADVHGSAEAIVQSINQVESHGVSVSVIHTATGPVTENDVMLAKASSAIILAFAVPLQSSAKALAETEGVQVKSYSIIYEITDDIEKAVKGLFQPEFEEVEIGRAEVRQLFKFSKVGSIAGCQVSSGKIIRNHTGKVFRDDSEIFAGKIQSLKRFKEDAREVLSGYECGIVLDEFNDLQEGDIIVCYELQEKNKF